MRSDYVFKPVEGRLYHLQGRARDHSDYVARDWYVNAIELHNEPPVIDWYSPDSICPAGYLCLSGFGR